MLNRWTGLGVVLGIFCACACSHNGDEDSADGPEIPVPLPVAPQTLVEGVFSNAEGIAFNDEGRLFVTADKGVHEVFADGTTAKIAELVEPVGMAHDGEGNLLVADWGATHPILGGETPGKNDGSVVRVSPDGAVETAATGIPDPNFIALWSKLSYLVSDDLDTYIYKVDEGSQEAVVWLDSIVTPNGLAFSPDRKSLYVCQTFAATSTAKLDNRVWRVPLDDNGNPGSPELLADLPAGSAPDGIALDAQGRVYVAANMKATIWRIDPETKETVAVATDVPSVASLAFGRGGDFPETSLYATSLFTGKIFKLDLGVTGAYLP